MATQAPPSIEVVSEGWMSDDEDSTDLLRRGWTR
jgi:hypothetical protein